MKNLKKYFNKKKVLITGHTGFKGTWLTLWLNILGAKVYGISNGYTSNPAIYKILKLKKKINHKNLDLRNFIKIKNEILKIKPDYIFHLGAQSLVKNLIIIHFILLKLMLLEHVIYLNRLNF